MARRLPSNLTVTLSPTQLAADFLLGMLALCQKRRRQEDEEDARRRQRYWDWRAVDPADYNPVYPFMPPPTPGSDVIIPTPMPPFFSDIDFYLSNLSVLNIRTSAPIIHTINGLALNLGTGLKLEDGKLTAEGGGPGGKTYTGAAPITVDNTQNKIGLSIGNGLQVVNNALETKPLRPVHPIKIAGDLIYLALGQGFYYDQQADALVVYLGNGLQFSSTGAIELTNPPQADLTALAPVYITDGQVSLSYDSNYFKIDTTSNPQKLQLNMGDPFEVTQTGIDLKVGANVRVNDSGQLTVDLPSYSAPLALTGTAPSQTLTLNTAAPFKVTGNNLTLDYESPLNLTENKLSLTVEDPLEAGTNGLKIRLGQGLSTDNSGALQVTTVSQNLSAENPLHIVNDTISLHTDAGFLVDAATHSLKLNVAEPLQVDSTTGLGLNTDPNMFTTNDSQQLQLNIAHDSAVMADSTGLGIKINTGLYKAQTGHINVNVAGGDPIRFDNYGALTLNFGNGFQKKNSTLELKLRSPLTSATNDGSLALNLASGLVVDAKNMLALNLEAPLNISNSKVALQYEAPLTVIDDTTLSVTVEEPLSLGTNGIELMLGPALKKLDTGGLDIKPSNSILVDPATGAEVRCVNPLYTATTGLNLRINSATLEVDSNNQLNVKAVPVTLNAVGPMQYTANTGQLKLSFNPYQFLTEYSGSTLSLMCPTYIYQTPPNQPMRLRNGTYSEYGNAEIRLIRQGMLVTFNINMIGETLSTGTQTWTIKFDGYLGMCLSGDMKVYTGQGNVDPNQYPSWILPLEALYNTQKAQGFMPIVCSENGAFKQSTYCAWRLYKLTENNYDNFCIELKSTTSSCKPIFQMSFTYEAGVAMT